MTNIIEVFFSTLFNYLWEPMGTFFTGLEHYNYRRGTFPLDECAWRCGAGNWNRDSFTQEGMVEDTLCPDTRQYCRIAKHNVLVRLECPRESQRRPLGF